MGIMVMGVIVMTVVMLATRQQECADDVHAEPDYRNQGCFAKRNLDGLEKPQERFDPNSQGDKAKHER